MHHEPPAWPPVAVAWAGKGEHDAGAEDARREEHDDRPYQPRQRRGRALAPVWFALGVVAGEPVADGSGLEGDRAEEQHAEEDVQGEQAADPQDRVALDGQQDQQHRSCDRGQPLVALGAAGALGGQGWGNPAHQASLLRTTTNVTAISAAASRT